MDQDVADVERGSCSKFCVMSGRTSFDVGSLEFPKTWRRIAVGLRSFRMNSRGLLEHPFVFPSRGSTCSRGRGWVGPLSPRIFCCVWTRWLDAREIDKLQPEY